MQRKGVFSPEKGVKGFLCYVLEVLLTLVKNAKCKKKFKISGWGILKVIQAFDTVYA